MKNLVVNLALDKDIALIREVFLISQLEIEEN